MKKIILIIQREYITRVKKKSFIVMTILGPLLMAALMVAPVFFATMENSSLQKVAVIDQSKKYEKVLVNTKTISFEFIKDKSVEDIKKDFENSGYNALLTIPENDKTYTVYSDKQVEITVISYIEDEIEKFKETSNLQKDGISPEQISSAKENIYISTIKWTNEGDEKSSPVVGQIVGFIFAIIIYMFIFMYGVQVMRGVIEEKTSRIVEVIISSVKPFQLMLGKIVGIAMVALTQFLLWIILTLIIVSTILPMFGVSGGQLVNQNAQNTEIVQNASNNEFADIVPALLNTNWTLLIFVFLIFFIGGYLLYASMFAAIGSAVDNETDTQQFMLPVTIPLILAFIMAQGIMRDPVGDMAFWFSMIPFTSPIIMPMRVAMESAAIWEILLSAFILILTFFGTVWVAAKIYRTGILMYGKKISYKELWKWLRY